MGRHGKLRKRRKLESHAFVDPTLAEGELPSDEALSTTAAVLAALVASPDDVYQHPKLRPIRSLLAQLPTVNNHSSSNNPIQQVSDSLKDGRPADALAPLDEMHRTGVVPKLGSLCRWTRDIDAVRTGSDEGIIVEPDPTVLAALDKVLRVCNPSKYPYQLSQGRIEMIGDSSWACKPLQYPETGKIKIVTVEQQSHWKSLFREIHRQAAADRQPPNRYDLIIHTSEPNAVRLSTTDHQISRVEVPGIDGAFMINNVLSPQECGRIVEAAESVGFQPDAPQGSGANASVLAHNFVYLIDEEMERILYERVRSLFPAEIRGSPIVGINRRWRIYRYADPKQTYRCHIDGAWTGSGLKRLDDGTEVYLPDAFGDCSSRLTFLIYLNEGFTGGETIYYRPSSEQPGVLEARRVSPRLGSVMVFPHGTVEGNPLHEGAAVFEGCKYIARTEVLCRGFAKN